ncbi:ATP-grasp domain-containing protein [Streptomyces sp. NPDC004126]|uniref:ATP-grasp domain-containing protein n=1 Tax=Streptomyces sp. NPDC004126 TaxID=3390695 RepID=UPI003D086DC5
MTARHVVVVDPYSSGAKLPGLLRRAGLVPVGVTSYPVPPPVYTTAFRPQDFEVLLEADSDDPAALVAVLAALRPVAVLAGAESGVLLADRLAAALTPGLANDPGLAPARRHKGLMAEALAAAGVPAIRSAFVRGADEAWAWVRECALEGRDLVVKPALSGGTEDVTLVPAADEERLRTVVGHLLRRVNVLGLPNDEVVVQERVTGTEYVVDTFSHGGRHTVTNICRYGKTANAGSFAVYESVEFLPYDLPGHAELVAYTERALDALGVRFGLAHSEVMLTPDGPRLIETGVRPPGAGLPALAELATGESGLDRLTRWLADGADPRPDYRLLWPVAAVYAIAPTTGTIGNLDAYRRALDLPSCRHVHLGVGEGDFVPATTDLLSTLRLGWAVLAHHDPHQLHRDRLAFRELEREVHFTDTTTGPILEVTPR